MATRPDLPPSLDRPWRCWHDLEHDRAWTTDLVGVSMGSIRGVSRPAPLYWQALLLWCQANGVSDEDQPFIIAQVRAMDAVYLKYHNDQITRSVTQFMKG